MALKYIKKNIWNSYNLVYDQIKLQFVEVFNFAECKIKFWRKHWWIQHVKLFKAIGV